MGMVISGGCGKHSRSIIPLKTRVKMHHCSDRLYPSVFLTLLSLRPLLPCLRVPQKWQHVNPKTGKQVVRLMNRAGFVFEANKTERARTLLRTGIRISFFLFSRAPTTAVQHG